MFLATRSSKRRTTSAHGINTTTKKRITIMKKKEIIASALLAAAALLAVVGCQKQDVVTAGSSVSFSVSVAGQEGAKSAAGVKSVLYNEADDIQTDGNTFVCSAYNTTKDASLFTGETVTYSETSSRWSTEAAYTWYPNEIITFHAVYPATAAGTGDGEAAIASDGTGISISNYEVADNAASQIDLMLGYYSGNGNNSGTAAINFKHPFTAVRFKMGDLAEFIPGFTGINSITISNVYTGGSLALWNGSTFSWTPASTTKDVTMTVGGANPEAGEYIVGTDASAKAFTLIPQDLATKTATITVSYNATVSGSIVATINQVSTTSTQWEAGKVYTYTINYKTMPVTIDDSGTPVTGWTTDTIESPIEADDAN